MDPVSRAFYEQKVENTLLTLRGNAYQDWFSTLMELRYPGGDFVRIRPWGKLGDRKNDGYVRSCRTLCQVYAPDDFALATTINKIDEDFDEAKPYWQAHFDTWVFVHNAWNGMPADVLKHLLDKQVNNKPIKVNNWGPKVLRGYVFELSDVDIAVLLGPAVTRRDFENLGLKELQPVLLKLASQDPAADTTVRPVPPKKIEANALSANVGMLLRAGMPKADLVQRFFDNYHDPDFGDRVAAAFGARYAELRSNGGTPDNIFSGLGDFAGGLHGDPGHDAAVLAVLAFLFEQCDIFERPPDGPKP